MKVHAGQSSRPHEERIVHKYRQVEWTWVPLLRVVDALRIGNEIENEKLSIFRCPKWKMVVGVTLLRGIR